MSKIVLTNEASAPPSPAPSTVALYAQGNDLYAKNSSGTVTPLGGPITAADITDSTTVGRSVLTAVDAAAARTAIGASSAGLPTAAAAGAVPVSDGAGTTYTATDLLAAVRSALVFDPSPLTASTGWTITPPSGGTATRSGGSLVIAVPSGSAAAVGEGLYEPSWPDGATAFAIQGRVQISSVDTQVGIHARAFVTYAHPIDINQAYFFFEALADGTCSFQVRSTVTATFTGPLDGTLWWRMEFSWTSVGCYSGIGSGDTAPTAWVYRGSLPLTAWFNTTVGKGLPPYVLLTGGMEASGPTTSTITVTHRAVSLEISL